MEYDVSMAKKIKMLQQQSKTSTAMKTGAGTDCQWWRTGVEHVHNMIKPAGEQYKQMCRLKTRICETTTYHKIILSLL